MREYLKDHNATYLPMTARQIGADPVSQSVDLVDAVEPESDYLGESEGVEIVISRARAALLTHPMVDWVTSPDGNSGFTFTM